MSDILFRAKELESYGIAIRRQIHKNPELGFDLPKTIGLVETELISMGYKPVRCGTAGITVTAGKPGRTFLLRADMDALPMKEETGLEFASENEYMHACGHDIHTSALLVAARILKEREEELQGTVKLMFQPCEEGVAGALDMVRAGVLESPFVDAAMALHVVHGKYGSVGYSWGTACASSDVFAITVKGKGGHGAAPHNCVDPINAAVHMHMALQAVNSREVHPDEMLVLSICEIHGGTASNIFPETVVMKGTIRTMNPKVRSFAKDRLVQIAKQTAAVFRAEAEIEFLHEGVPPMKNDTILLQETTGYINRILGEGTCYELPRMTGSEDFSVLSQLVPSVLYWVGTGSEEEGYPYGVHDPRVTFDEKSLHKMAAIYAGTAMEWLRERS
ncbi:M20 family metallopeptidase [Clostridium boliviensis]|uniref:M20 family metallopeptidase n=1 Tax=Clostridium boliviensis TaxID=318465 RepID=A0ABU4GSN1_9CLOT|nr:M20 family metallopeptidase [Clostridium boliviensis]MDW2799948.1 M20 family metallopeptidase [Clostridium boliviensis]